MSAETSYPVSRRNFIKAAAALPAAGACLYNLSNAGPLKCGIVGCGNQGKKRIGLSDPKFIKLTGVYDIDQKQAKSMNHYYQYTLKHKPIIYKHYDDLLNNNDIEAVVIATPTMSHGELAINALQAGKHVFVERMMAATPNECRQMRILAKKNNLLIQVGHPQFFSPVFWDVFQLIWLGVLGNIYHIRIETGNIHSINEALQHQYEYQDNHNRSWKHNSNLSYGIWSEQFCDWIAWVNGFFPNHYPLSVIAHSNRVNKPEYYDIDSNLFALIEYQNNLTVSFSSLHSWNSVEMDYLQLMGTRGTIKLVYDWRVNLYQTVYIPEPGYGGNLSFLILPNLKNKETLIDFLQDNELAEVVSAGASPIIWQIKKKGTLTATLEYMTRWELSCFAHAVRAHIPILSDDVLGSSISNTCYAAHQAAITHQRVLVEI